MCTYLAKRGSTYYYRRPIPAELRPALGGRTEYMVSLRTKDREEAKRRIPALTIKTDRLLDAARMVGRPDRPETARQGVSPAEAARSAAAHQAMLDGLEIQAAEEAAWEHKVTARAALYERIRADRTKGTDEIGEERAAVRDVMRDLTYELQTAQEHLLAERARRTQDGGTPDGPEPAKAVVRDKAAAEPGPMLDIDIVNGWAAERRPARKTVDAHRAVARWFYERVGRKPVAEITRRDVIFFKAKLIEEGTSQANGRTKLQRLRTLLQWAADNDYAPSNVADGVTIRVTDQERTRRREFDLASLNRIFASPVYSEGVRPTQGRGEAAYWLPLMALYTGARMEELGQLRPSDVREHRYPDQNGEEQSAWFIHITSDEADDLKIKNAGSERLVPVHPELERLGLVIFVQAARKAGQSRLFPDLRPDKYGRLTAKWGEWFSSYLRGTCLVTDRRMVFHSFRHTFKHYARHVGINEGVQRQIMGHSSGDVADDYGSGYSLFQVVEGMRSFRVPGFNRLGS